MMPEPRLSLAKTPSTLEHSKEQTGRNLKKITIEILKYSIAAALMYWLISTGKIDLVTVKKNLTLDVLLVGGGIITICIMLSALRWRLILAAQGIQVDYLLALRLSFLGIFSSFVLPGALAGDAVRAVITSRQSHLQSKQQKWKAASSVFVDRYIGLVAMCGLALTFSFFASSNPQKLSQMNKIQTFIGSVFFILVIAGSIFFSKRTNALIARPFQQSKWPALQKINKLILSFNFILPTSVVFNTLLISIIGHISTLFLFFYVGLKINPDLPTFTFLYGTPIGLLFLGIPIAPGGIGVGQSAFYYIFNLYGITPSNLGPTLITIYQLFLVCVSGLGSFVFIQYKFMARKTLNRSQEAYSKD